MNEKVTAMGDDGSREINRIACDEISHSWENRLPGETAQAFRAFSLFRSMGFKRSIKGCLALHEIDDSKYGSWSRWSRIFEWSEKIGRAHV